MANFCYFLFFIYFLVFLNYFLFYSNLKSLTLHLEPVSHLTGLSFVFYFKKYFLYLIFFAQQRPINLIKMFFRRQYERFALTKCFKLY